MLERSEVIHIARLARLELSDEEIGRMGVELSGILDHVERIGELDLSGVEPTAHAVAQSGALREDLPGDSLPREAALAQAPQTDGIGFEVPSPGGGA
jgi:aspartyl-tRNA(Asn)/glutamyl-tRNA(Gln) amidotransferase subunit C